MVPAGPSKLGNTSYTANDAAESADESVGESSDSENEVDEDGDVTMGSTPNKSMTARQKRQAADRLAKANQRSVKKVRFVSTSIQVNRAYTRALHSGEEAGTEGKP